MQRTRVIVRVTNLSISYETGRLVEQAPEILSVDPITVDPPPYALDAGPTNDVSGIQGRVIINGGRTFQDEGDTVILHNRDGGGGSGLVVNRELPRMEVQGANSDGTPQYVPAQDENGPIIDEYVSLEGFGLTDSLDASGWVRGVSGGRPGTLQNGVTSGLQSSR